MPFTQEMKFWYETDLINQTLSEDYDIEIEIDTELFPEDHFHPFPLPEIEDFPMISLIDQDRLKHLDSLLEKVHKTKEEIEAMIEEDEKGFAYEHIMGLKENIAFCIDNRLDMIAFCH